jgi:dihydrolipoamide dehydrogenase
MEEYDVIVIGSGSGMNVAANAVNSGMRVALLEHGPMGGTCLNNGCIPSKVLLHPADVIRAMDDASKIGVKSGPAQVDFRLIMKRMHSFVDHDRLGMERGVNASESMEWFKDTGEFVGDYTMKVGKKEITAPKVIIASGARSFIPPIQGIKETGFIDNISVLNLKQAPKSIIIIGGGYIACEYGHFFSAIGTQVTILGRNPRLLKNEEPEVSEIVMKRFSKYANIYTGYEGVRAGKEKGHKYLIGRNRQDGKEYKFTADEIMLAAGRISNADMLKPENTGVETTKGGWIKVNQYLETSKPGIWALGDALGTHMFRHTANYEADIVWTNAFTEYKREADYHAVPHAVFGYPQVGGVGLTEAQAKAAGNEVLVGKATYTDVAKGFAMGEDEGFVKVIVEAKTRKILGCHIVGSEAADLVQPVVYLMNTDDQDYVPMARSQVIHPALSEVVTRAFGNLISPDHVHGQEHGHEQGHEHQHEQQP